MKLQGKRALITGSNQGLGLAIARAFVAEGAHVMLCARDAGRLEQARREVAETTPAGIQVLAAPADVSKPEEVRCLIDQALAGLGGLDVLVANAGVYGPKGPIDEVDWDEWVVAVQINLLGAVLTCRAVLPHFKQRRRGKIVVISGGGATRPIPFLSAYAASKAAVVRFAETLAAEVADSGIDVNSVAPGALNTRLLDEILAAGPNKIGKQFYEAALKQQQTGGDPLELGAGLCVFLASSESDGLTGKLIAAKWDPWRQLAAHRDELRASDIYTLRRIVPADRGKGWGG